MKLWWEEYPGLLEAEYAQLREIGAQFTEREDEKARGLLVLDIVYRLDDRELALEARFPDTYPYARPEVYARRLQLDHHQNPFDTNLCVLGRRSDNWTPQMSLAFLLKEQLPKVLASNRLPKDESRDLEEDQGEPVTAFFNFEQDSVCFVDGSWSLATGDTGNAAFAVTEGTGYLTAIVASLRVGAKEAALPSLPAFLPDPKMHPGRFVQLEKPIVERDPLAFDRTLSERMPGLGTRRYPYGLDCILVGFPEEHARRELGQGWILLVRQKTSAKGRAHAETLRLVRVQRVGLTDFAARAPVILELHGKRVALFGTGCVGAPIAMELGKAALGSLTMIDHDVVEGAGSVRWPLGVTAAGMWKVLALTASIRENNPHLEVINPVPYRVGGVAQSPELLRDSIFLPNTFSSHDLIVDATAEFGIQRLLSDFALRYNVPYVGVHATNGAHGGQVFRVIKGRTGCANCLAWHQAEGTINNPPELAGDWQQPAGCAAPTFIGTSWDLQEVSLQAVRLAISTLLGKAQDWDVAILSMVDGAGAPQPPNWKTFGLPAHPNCTPCLAQ